MRAGLGTHYLMSPGHVPNLKRLPREVLAEGRYFHAIDTWERSLPFCVQELGEERPGLTERAKRKILSENAIRLCPRLRE